MLTFTAKELARIKHSGCNGDRKGKTANLTPFFANRKALLLESYLPRTQLKKKEESAKREEPLPKHMHSIPNGFKVGRPLKQQMNATIRNLGEVIRIERSNPIPDTKIKHKRAVTATKKRASLDNEVKTNPLPTYQRKVARNTEPPMFVVGNRERRSNSNQGCIETPSIGSRTGPSSDYDNIPMNLNQNKEETRIGRKHATSFMSDLSSYCNSKESFLGKTLQANALKTPYLELDLMQNIRKRLRKRLEFLGLKGDSKRTEQRLEIYRDTFTEVIRSDTRNGPILQEIKEVYEARIRDLTEQVKRKEMPILPSHSKTEKQTILVGSKEEKDKRIYVKANKGKLIQIPRLDLSYLQGADNPDSGTELVDEESNGQESLSKEDIQCE